MASGTDGPLARTGLRYLIAGAFVAALYPGVYAILLLLGVQYFVGILASQSVAISIAFPLYRRFVFGPGASILTDLIRFLTVWAGGLVAGLIITPLVVELLSWNPWLAQVVAMAFVTTANFVAHRFWTFRRPHEGDDELHGVQ